MSTRNIDDILEQLQNRKSEVEGILTSHGVEFSKDRSEFQFKTQCPGLHELKVAAIMDEFTLLNFKDECTLLEVTPDDWETQLREFRPDMFFLESAWNGKDKSWYRKIANGSKELEDVTTYCHDNGIPVVFWNKEDPVYTATFMFAASCADYVFTTDFDCIEKYKQTLHHNSVFFLPFSAQPRVHNPVEIHDRKDKFCFAGAYYHRYVDRCRVFDSFADVFEQGKGLDIYDRNFGHARPEHAFPQRYDDMIVGTLSPDDIHIAYKGYNYGVNMNSVGQSQTMFARRVYELLASNTVSVGNYARGCKNLFGDLTVCTDSAETMKKQFDKYCSSETDYRKYRLLGLRKVIESHLCEDRLGFIARCVFGKDMREPLPDIYILSNAEGEEAIRVKASFDKQTWEKKHLIFVKGENVSLPQDSFAGVMSPDDYYGENYLKDLALSVRYSDCDGFGKVNYYSNGEDGIVLNGRESTYKECRELNVSRGIFKATVVDDLTSFVQGCVAQGNFFCTDEFNYCECLQADACVDVDDIYVADTGVELEKINEQAASVNCEDFNADVMSFSSRDMYDMYHSRERGISVSLEGEKFVVASKLGDENIVYLDVSNNFPLGDVLAGDSFSAFFNSSGDLDIVNFCIFYDSTMKEIGRGSSVGSRVLTAQIPKNTEFVRLTLRIKGSGRREFSSITIGSSLSAMSATPILLRSDVLVLSDHYPSYDDLYRYMFVHKRNMLYKDNGLVVDMLCMDMWNENRYREFENINVIEGASEKLMSILSSGSIKTLCVHFLNPYMWDVIKNYLDKINLIIWSHGSDILPWYRRQFNYRTKAELNEAKAQSEKKERLWKEVFEYSERYNIHFVCVSEFFKHQIEEDYNVDLADRCSVIHNCIDTDMFTYEKKSEDMRYKIMTVKSFSSPTYANDITQQAILKLSKEPEFDRMTFDIYGDGEYFKQDTDKIKKFPNVHLHRQFLTQSEIAALHKEHGIYIATTRTDTQGVSRDEAMASGLVPVANKVAAIPEFVDDNCGMLVPPEDSDGVADAVLKLCRDPELFLRLSENAAKKVRSMTTKEFTIDKETELIQNYFASPQTTKKAKNVK